MLKPLLASLMFLVIFAAGGTGSPCVVHIESINYPQLARLARIDGDVTVEVKLAADGRVENASVRTGHPMLKAEAEANVRKWRFHTNTETTLLVTYHFRLESPAVDYIPLPNIAYDLPSNVTVTSKMAKQDH